MALYNHRSIKLNRLEAGDRFYFNKSGCTYEVIKSFRSGDIMYRSLDSGRTYQKTNPFWIDVIWLSDN